MENLIPARLEDIDQRLMSIQDTHFAQMVAGLEPNSALFNEIQAVRTALRDYLDFSLERDTVEDAYRTIEDASDVWKDPEVKITLLNSLQEYMIYSADEPANTTPDDFATQIQCEEFYRA